MKKFFILFALFTAMNGMAAETCELVSTVTPTATLQQHTHNGVVVKNVLAGVEHRYEKAEGLNTRLHLSGMKQSEKTHYTFLVEGLYKFQAQNNIAVYPSVGLSWSRYGTTPDTESKSEYLIKNAIHAGLGIEKSFYKFLVLGVKGCLSQDLAVRTYQHTSGYFAGETHANSTGYRVTGYFHLSLFGKGVVELEPFYGKCFEGRYEEHGAKIAYSFSI
jgi:hypothetical protein